MPAIPGNISVYRSPKPDIRTFQMLVPQHVKEAMISEDGQFTQTEVLSSKMVKLSLGGVSLHDLPKEEMVSGARTHSNNTAEMTAMIEALSFLGPHGPVARGVESCI